MSTNKTEHLQLHQWESGDVFSREEINENFAAIDEAAGGQLRMATGSYPGTGKYGVNDPVTLSFDFAPKLVMVENAGDRYGHMLLFAPETSVQVRINSMTVATETVRWNQDGKTVAWYCATNSDNQLNTNGRVYHYVAWG